MVLYRYIAAVCIYSYTKILFTKILWLKTLEEFLYLEPDNNNKSGPKYPYQGGGEVEDFIGHVFPFCNCPIT